MEPSESNNPPSNQLPAWRRRTHDIIFEADTFSGRFFDIILLVSIALSVTLVMLETVVSFNASYGDWFMGAEWVFTILFTIEYVLRLISVKQPLKYAFSFFGIVDFLSIIPTYLALFAVPEQAHYLTTIRILRLLRLFRIFKMARYIGGANLILMALRASRPKIVVFLFAVVTMAIIMGTIMYIVEGPSNPVLKHTRVYLLGDCHHHNRWLRGHRSSASVREISRIVCHDHWLCYYRGSNGDRWSGNQSPNEAETRL